MPLRFGLSVFSGVSAPQRFWTWAACEGNKNMNKRTLIATAVIWGLLSAAHAGFPPVVSNVVATPQAGGTVVITYNLADTDTAALSVSVSVSSDGGATYSTIPSTASLSGAVGSGVARGTGRRIVWSSCQTFPGVNGGSYKVRVTADDGTSGWVGGGSAGDMVFIPAGSFLMGNNGSEPYSFSNEWPQHSVYLSGYWIGKYEVTRGDYRAFMNAGGYSNSAYWSSAGWSWRVSNGRTEPYYWAAAQDWYDSCGHCSYVFAQTDAHPVVGVSYYEAEAFCKWAGGRLPTEAEWEKAARWTGSYPNWYPWGNPWDAEKCNNWYDHNVAGGGYQRYQTAPVGSYPEGVSPYGCHDMAGNVWEWCRDWYLPDYYSLTPPGGWGDPQGPSSGHDRVTRSGSWDMGEWFALRCAVRSYMSPSDYWLSVGFRLAR